MINNEFLYNMPNRTIVMTEEEFMIAAGTVPPKSKVISKRLVISRYDENLFWLNKINFPYTLYNKGFIINVPNIELPNVGKEGETYLRYILENYDNLEDFIIFCQGDPLKYCNDFINKVNNHTEITNINMLSDFISTDDMNGNPNHPGLKIHEVSLKLGLPLKSEYTFAAGSQYIVPKSLIINKSIEWWKKCYNVYNSNELSPWIFERIWPLIFNYEKK